MTEATKAALYPRYCFHLSPTVNTWCLLRAADIHALDQHAGFEGENFFFYRNLPIKWVRVVGIVVAIEQFFNRRLYTIDDSSGRNIIAVTTPPAPAKAKNESTAGEQRTDKGADAQEADPYADIDVGAVVDVKGSVSSFRNEHQINIERMAVVKSTAQEVVLWEKRTRFRREVLNVPWVLRDKDVRRCRRDAERSEAEAEKKKAKKQSKAKEARSGITKLPTRDSRSKISRDDSVTKTVQKIIREGAATGKYNALGL
ncbi:telomere regulation protein stn1 domain-containing protein [Trichoderma breve]|uniref:Telomere regulation protein stn1 domain-containing protein n=1 Tax=Trichoderma breve TaxID=2034170 RepID=A0A9W9BL14_9HYPO|nr:telomere regulation protein stn1 domain-containing protein [Trichoderma breve]KAJ4861596.1 telomere regulation protein stn1 domain-containing protein [Trichoderma breve]